MSYSLGQAKLVPGQIHFQTTRTGRIPSLRPLVEAGLPIAPYIEHGSYATGQPAIMRYGLDPYRGLSGIPPMTPVQERNSTFEIIIEGLRCWPPQQWRGRGLKNARKAALRLAGKHRADAHIYLSGGVPSLVETVYFARPLGSNGNDLERRADDMQTAIETTITETIRGTLSPAMMIGTGAVVGGVAGLSGGLLKRPIWGALIGAVSGGVLGWLGWQRFGMPARMEPSPPPEPATAGLNGTLVVL